MEKAALEETHDAVASRHADHEEWLKDSTRRMRARPNSNGTRRNPTQDTHLEAESNNVLASYRPRPGAARNAMPTSMPKISRTYSSSRPHGLRLVAGRPPPMPGSTLQFPEDDGTTSTLLVSKSRSGPASGRQRRLRVPCCSRATRPLPGTAIERRPGVKACPSRGGRALPGRVPRRFRERAATVRRWEVVHSQSGAGETTGRRESSHAKSAGMSSRAHQHRASGERVADRAKTMSAVWVRAGRVSRPEVRLVDERQLWASDSPTDDDELRRATVGGAPSTSEICQDPGRGSPPQPAPDRRPPQARRSLGGAGIPAPARWLWGFCTRDLALGAVDAALPCGRSRRREPLAAASPAPPKRAPRRAESPPTRRSCAGSRSPTPNPAAVGASAASAASTRTATRPCSASSACRPTARASRPGIGCSSPSNPTGPAAGSPPAASAPSPSLAHRREALHPPPGRLPLRPTRLPRPRRDGTPADTDTPGPLLRQRAVPALRPNGPFGVAALGISAHSTALTNWVQGGPDRPTRNRRPRLHRPRSLTRLHPSRQQRHATPLRPRPSRNPRIHPPLTQARHPAQSRESSFARGRQQPPTPWAA